MSNREKVLEEALKVATVTIFNSHPEDMIKIFSVDETKKILRDTQHLIGKKLKVEEILHKALFPK